MTTDEIINLKIPCFSCEYGHSCKYYNNILWDDWLFRNPQDGCPATKYPYESIYIAAMRYAEEKKERQKYRKSSEWNYAKKK